MPEKDRLNLIPMTAGPASKAAAGLDPPPHGMQAARQLFEA
jgi:hypothetical protein